jgi:histidinol-phosphate phosphatase family protein
LNPQAEEPLRHLRRAGYLLLATTNQPGLSHGSQSRRELDLMHGQLERAFRLDGVLLCPHAAADDCPCRKPKAGLILEAAFKWHLDLDRSFVISDKWQDAQAAHIAGCTSILIRSPWTGSGHRDFIVPILPPRQRSSRCNRRLWCDQRATPLRRRKALQDTARIRSSGRASARFGLPKGLERTHVRCGQLVREKPSEMRKFHRRLRT